MNRKTLTILAAMALVLAACGGGGTTADADGRVVIDLTEFEFSPNSIELVVGQEVTLVLSNEGEKEHEFMIGENVNTDPGYPNGFEVDFFDTTDAVVDPMDAMEGMEGEEEMGHTGLMVVRQPGQEATITFTPTAESVGEWQIGCFEEEGAHWDDGMQGTLTVVEG